MKKKEEANKEELHQEAKDELKSFREQTAELREMTAHLGEEAKKQFEIRAKELEELYAEAEKKYAVWHEKAGKEWHEFKDFVELTNKALRHSFNYFMSHYRKK